jgi:tetratricopeptide (TPR) repeat protein
MKRVFVVFVALSLFACSAAPPPPESPKPPAEIPVTSISTEAIDHFKKGRDLADNSRNAEAAQELDQALKLDPDFALAMTYHGSVIPGPEGVKEMEQANAKAASLSKPEQLFIGAMLASYQNDFAKAEDLWKQAAEAVPTDWRVQMGRGTRLFLAEKYSEAIDTLNKATAINQDAGPASNLIGYSYLFQGEGAPAVDALKKYASLLPNEPNPQDSLGEALMAQGQFADGEAAFRKAISLSPAFAISWDGVAYTKFFAGDWAGGKAAVAKEREAALRPAERLLANRLAAFASLAEGKTAEGLKQIDAIDKSSDATPDDTAFTPANRALVMVETGRYKDAVTEAAKSMALAEGGQVSAGVSSNLRRFALAVTASAQGRMGDAAGAEKTVAALQQAATAAPDDPNLKSTVHFAQGMLGAAQKDMKGAQTHFGLCSNQDVYCQWQAFELSQKVGDKEGASASLARLTKIYRRDPLYLYARSTASPMARKPSS